MSALSSSLREKVQTLFEREIYYVEHLWRCLGVCTVREGGSQHVPRDGSLTLPGRTHDDATVPFIISRSRDLLA